jgi:hypothetical protein
MKVKERKQEILQMIEARKEVKRTLLPVLHALQCLRVDLLVAGLPSRSTPWSGIDLC